MIEAFFSVLYVKICLGVIAMATAAYILAQNYTCSDLLGRHCYQFVQNIYPSISVFIGRSSLKLDITTQLDWPLVYRSGANHLSSEASFPLHGDAPMKISEGPARTLGAAPKFLVFLCDALESCGGWADRQEGIVLVYFFSRLVQREFRIVMPPSCALSDLFAPNVVQWIPVEQEFTSPSPTNTIDLTNGQAVDQVMNTVLRGDFNIKYTQDVIYLKADHFTAGKFLESFSNSHRPKQRGEYKNGRRWFHWAWHELMKPSSTLISELKRILGESFLIRKDLLPPTENPRRDSMFDVSDSRLICAHLDTGPNATVQEGGDFRILGVDELEILQKFMTSIISDGNRYFFVATDNVNIHKQARNFFGNRFIDYGGKMMNRFFLERAPTPCDEQTEAVIDQMILSICDVLVVTKGQLGRMAYLMRNLTQSEYVLGDGKVVSFDGQPV
ncbi:hypothetical protein Btru_031993 [Bulinus truncatus]|nr:hypothetical protein Btru_031993 [Bulinus truncatus]